MPKKGYTITEEHRINLSLSHKGQKGYWAGKHRSQLTKDKISKKLKGMKLSEETKRKISETNKGRKPYVMTDKIRENMGKAQKGLRTGEKHFMFGKHHSEKTRRKMSEIKIGHIPWNKGKNLPQFYGENSSNWKGGVSSINSRIRKRIEMILWRKAIFERDDWTCQKCKKRGGIHLNAHHICNFADYPRLRISIKNGITFCRDCHKEFHKEYGFENNTKEQLKEFLLLLNYEKLPKNKTL